MLSLIRCTCHATVCSSNIIFTDDYRPKSRDFLYQLLFGKVSPHSLGNDLHNEHTARRISNSLSISSTIHLTSLGKTSLPATMLRSPPPPATLLFRQCQRLQLTFNDAIYISRRRRDNEVGNVVYSIYASVTSSIGN